jgi:hypothetical protein
MTKSRRAERDSRPASDDDSEESDAKSPTEPRRVIPAPIAN